jgi:hypothetical protein
LIDASADRQENPLDDAGHLATTQRPHVFYTTFTFDPDVASGVDHDFTHERVGKPLGER